jgi:hypothetical protein
VWFDLHFFYGMCFQPFGLLPLKRLCQFVCPFLHWVIDFFGSLVFELPVYSGYQPLARHIAEKDFLPFCGWPLPFRDHFFCCTKLFNFMWSHLSTSSFYFTPLSMAGMTAPLSPAIAQGLANFVAVLVLNLDPPNLSLSNS